MTKEIRHVNLCLCPLCACHAYNSLLFARSLAQPKCKMWIEQEQRVVESERLSGPCQQSISHKKSKFWEFIKLAVFDQLLFDIMSSDWTITTCNVFSNVWIYERLLRKRWRMFYLCWSHLTPLPSLIISDGDVRTASSKQSPSWVP